MCYPHTKINTTNIKCFCFFCLKKRETQVWKFQTCVHLRVTMRVVLQVTVPWMFSAWQMYSPESSGVTSMMTSTWVLRSLRTWVRWVGVTCTSFTNHFTSASGCESSSTSSLKTHKMVHGHLCFEVNLHLTLTNNNSVIDCFAFEHWSC